MVHCPSVALLAAASLLVDFVLLWGNQTSSSVWFFAPAALKRKVEQNSRIFYLSANFKCKNDGEWLFSFRIFCKRRTFSVQFTQEPTKKNCCSHSSAICQLASKCSVFRTAYNRGFFFFFFQLCDRIYIYFPDAGYVQKIADITNQCLHADFLERKSEKKGNLLSKRSQTACEHFFFSYQHPMVPLRAVMRWERF